MIANEEIVEFDDFGDQSCESFGFVDADVVEIEDVSYYFGGEGVDERTDRGGPG